MQLRNYQEDCLNNIVAEARKGCIRQVVVLATGTGKTVIFSHLPPLVRNKGKKTLILAHREELLDQARNKLLAIDSTLKVGIEQADREASPDDDVIVASVPTLGRLGSKRIMKFKPEEFGLIIIDECHHAVASGYKNILKHFGILKGECPEPKGIVLVGVTATSTRADHQGLDQIFDKITFSYTIQQGIKENYLANIAAYTVNTNTDISRVGSSMGDFAEKELSDAVNNDERNKLAKYIRDSYPDALGTAPTISAIVIALLDELKAARFEKAKPGFWARVFGK